MIAACELFLPCGILKCFCLCLCDPQKRFLLWRFHNAIPHNSRQIFRRCMMNSVFVFSIQPVWCHKIRVVAPQFFCFLIHQTCKLIHSSWNMLRHCPRTVIVRLQHNWVQEIFHIKLIAFLHPKMHFRLSCCFFRNCYNIVKISFFQRKNTGHNLRGAGHRHHVISVFLQ